VGKFLRKQPLGTLRKWKDNVKIVERMLTMWIELDQERLKPCVLGWCHLHDVLD
jgi:hypothetical protein